MPWRALGLPYEESLRQLSGDLYAKKATVEFHASAHLDELIDVGVRCARVGNSSTVFSGAMFRGDQLLITCELLYVFADPATQTSRPVPPLLREVFLGFEGGEPMLDVRTGQWNELGEAAARIRTQVFVDEQRVPADMEWDEADATAVHVVAFNRLGQPVATGRLLQGAPGVAKIGRVAVHPVLRGSGVGRLVMDRLMAAARERGDHEVVLHAQSSAEAFYRRLGFAVRGEPFDEVGIEHIEMTASLRPFS